MPDDKTAFKYGISQTAQAVAPFHVMKILGEAKQLEAAGREIIHMEIGEPDFPSLDSVHQAAHEAVSQGLTHYTPTMGLPELRQKLAAFYLNFYKAEINAANIMITPGSSSALQLVLTSILDINDKVMIADPSYPCNRQFIQLLHADTLSVPVSYESNYQLNLDLVKSHWQPGIKAVIIASPANPTGTVIEQNELLAIADFLATQNCYLIVDEIYQGLVYDRKPESILAHDNLVENVIVINSFSKYFGMTGWRLGWTIAPSHLIPVLDRLGQNLFLSAPTPSQYGALRVLEKDALAELDKRKTIFEQRRNVLVNAMSQAGFKVKVIPQGAFYLYWDVAEYTDDSQQFCSELLQKTGVATTPGLDFGAFQANTHIRIAYTCDEKQIKTAVGKIVDFLQTQRNR